MSIKTINVIVVLLLSELVNYNPTGLCYSTNFTTLHNNVFFIQWLLEIMNKEIGVNCINEY